MFTINIYLRFAIIAVCLIGGLILAFTISIGYAIPIILIGVIFLAGYIFLGTVQSAAQLMQKGDLIAAEKRLNLTFKPQWLYTTNRAYYYLLKGTVAMQKNESDEAERWFEKAQSLELPSDNERAMVQLQLANINAMKSRWNAAKLHFRNVKKYKVEEPQMREQIKQFEKMLNNRGTIKTAQRMNRGKGMPIKPGGKRRRPKIK